MLWSAVPNQNEQKTQKMFFKDFGKNFFQQPLLWRLSGNKIINTYIFPAKW